MHDFTLHRRQMFQGLIALSAVGGLAACGQQQTAAKGDAPEPPPPGYFTPEEIGLISAVAQIIIPETDTAGAIQAGVPKTLQDLATEWGDEAFQLYWREGLTGLDAALTDDAEISFVSLPPDQQLSALAAYDTSVFAGDIENGFYRDLKATIVQAYYMSEPGATEELAYEAVPGEWIGCVPLSDYPRTWAT